MGVGAGKGESAIVHTVLNFYEPRSSKKDDGRIYVQKTE